MLYDIVFGNLSISHIELIYLDYYFLNQHIFVYDLTE